MATKKTAWLILFFGASAVEMMASLMAWEAVQLVAKPLIMLSLIVYYYLHSPVRSMLFVSALFFCWVGDVLLLFQGENSLFFMGGLIAFLIGHLIYMICYRQLMTTDTSKELLGTQKVRFSLPIILAGSGLVVVLYPSLGSLRVPVMVYALVLTLMVLNALFRLGRTTASSFALIFSGAICFMISDSILAVNKFLQPINGAGILIMLTYCLAQYLIVAGALVHEQELLIEIRRERFME